MLYRIIAIVSICIAAVGCQSLPAGGQLAGRTDATATAPKKPKSPKSLSLPASLEAGAPDAAPTDLWERIRLGLGWQAVHNPAVAAERDRYLHQRNYIPVLCGRASLYMYYIVEEVERRGLPMELALLPLVESGLDPFATSPDNAAGLWQIMPATGTHLGLEQDWWYDGRRDVRASTRAALDYLEALYREFDENWMLALAAYNAGDGRVAAAQRANARRGRPTDYWSLGLPRETRRYIPRLIALSQLIAVPEAFDLSLPDVPNRPAFTAVGTGGQVELARVAVLAEVDPDTLHSLNPGQLRWATAPDTGDLLVPPDAAKRLVRGLASLPEDQRVSWESYRIRRGDSLIRIAHKFDTEVALLRQVNHIRGSNIRVGDTLLIPNGGEWAASLALTGKASRQRRGYRVRRGDSLYRIAGRFKVSIDDIVAWNSLDPDNYLQPGQRLTLYVEGS